MISSKKENIAFSPYGLVSVALVLYEGSTGPSAAEIHNTLRLPWDREVTRVGFRDMHRYLKSYFSNDGFLRGLVLSKPNIMLRQNYTDLLQFYGFDVRTSPPKVPTTPVPPVLTTNKPATTTPPTVTTTPPLNVEPGKTTTAGREVGSRVETTTVEIPKQETTVTSLRGTETTLIPQTGKTTKSATTSQTAKPPPPTPTAPPITTEAPPKPTTTLPQLPTTKPSPPPSITTPPTTQAPLPPTTQPQTSTPPSTTTRAQTTKSADGMPLETTLDVITMTDKKPKAPEIMSQVNMSATATPATTSDQMEGRGGEADMDMGQTMLDTTAKPTTTEMKQTPTTPPTQPTTLETRDTVEVSISETTVSKSVSMLDPNTTPMTSTLSQGITEPEKAEMRPMTLIIETTTPPSLGEDATAAASESVINQGTTTLNEGITVVPEAMSNATSEENATVPPVLVLTDVPVIGGGIEATTPIGAAAETIQPQGGATESVLPGVALPAGVATESLPPIGAPTSVTPLPGVATTIVPPESATFLPPVTITQGAPTVVPPVTITLLEQTTVPATAQPQTLLGAMSLEPVEMNDSEATESQKVEALARQQRSLFSTHKTPEYHKSGSNWVPQYQDHRWGQNPSNEFWFFTFTGGENVPAHTYTAYLPFAFVPELSSLALQLPLDDPRYSILILLPEERLGLSQLLYSLQWCPVRAIMTHMKMTAVYAVVPAFTIVKHINLVPALAKMGIHSVFDPFRADMSPMATEPHLFVRTIEQVVTVSLRKYYASNRWFEAAPNEVRQHFVANHPFAYFVLDKETDVTLMAGTIVNPVAHNQ